jgi:phosphatidylinositol-3-phosphatase
VHGHGCVLPTAVYSLPDQLTGNGLTWKAYIAGQYNPAAPGAPSGTCRHPGVGSADATAALAAPADGYVSRRNPFVYFHSIIDTPSSCAKIDVGLDQLAADLQSGKVPALSWIAPDPCAAGATGGCAVPPPATTTSSTTTTSTPAPSTSTTTSSQASTVSSSSNDSPSSSDTSTASGSSSASSSTTIGVPKAVDAAADPDPTDAFLAQWVPKIEATAAYKKDGMIVILSDEAPASGPNADSSACCGKLSYVNTTDPGGAGKPGPGGGRTGALVLSSYAGRGVSDATPADHFTLLRTLDDIFNVPYLGYALQRKDFDSVVFPSESGGSGAVSTRVHAGVTIITRTLTSVSSAGSATAVPRRGPTSVAPAYAPLQPMPSFVPADPPPLSRLPSFASRG